MRRRRPELHTLAGAYALDALSEPDRVRFERHLARCRACAREERELRDATARLAGAVAADPPADLIERVVAATARIRQQPPVTGPARPRLAARPRPRLALAVAGVFLAAATALGALAFTAEHTAGAARQGDHLIAGVLNAPDAVLVSSRVKAGGSAAVVMSHRDRALVLTTDGLPPLPAGHRYQLWLMGPRGDRPVCLLPAPHEGMTSPVVATGLLKGDWVGLTVEPAAGSRQPTTPPILMLSLTA